MTDSMIERVAEAMWADWQANGKSITEAQRGLSWDLLLKGADSVAEIQWVLDDARSQARAAIKATRVPSAAVLAHLAKLLDLRPHELTAVWGQLISAALKEGE